MGMFDNITSGTGGPLTNPGNLGLGGVIPGFGIGGLGSIPNAPGLGSMLGTQGGAAGTGFKAPNSIPIQQGTDMGQIGSAYQGAQGSLAGQQALLAALQQQGGLKNQTSAYQQQQGLASQLANANGLGLAQNAIDTQRLLNSQFGNGAANVNNVYGQSQNLVGQMAGVNGVGNLNAALQSQQALAGQQQGVLGQYQDIAAGRGPNPAMAALAQQTGQNVANQAALMAGQRGAGANVGLLARQAGQQGAATQQQAVGQGATLQAQQQMNALQGITAQQQAIGQTQQNVANIAQQQVAAQQAQQQALAGQAQAQVGALQAGTAAQNQYANQLLAAQQAQQGQLAGQANTMAGQQIGATTANTQARQSEQQLLQNALASQNSQAVSQQGNINSANAGLAQTSMAGQQKMVGGILNGAGAAMGGAKGGMVKQPKRMYEGGDSGTPAAGVEAAIPQPAIDNIPTADPKSPQSGFGKFLTAGWAGANSGGIGGAPNAQGQKAYTGDSQLEQGSNRFTQGIANAMKPTAAAPSGEGALAGVDASAPEIAEMAALAAKGGVAKRRDFRSGGNVEAKNEKEKAVKSGNSYDNDKIPAVLSEGEIVIPRSVIQGKDPVRGAAEFVAKVMAKRGRKSA